jgi:aminoglycoside phosphotransferase
MKMKSRTARSIPQDDSPLRHLPLVDRLVDTRTELLELAMRSGLRVFTTRLEEDRTAICGPRYAHLTRALVEQARARFAKKWRLRCPAVVECLDEAGDDLFTFLRFPKAQWKALRTTNALERINGEFRRRTKTQASLPSQDTVLLLLFGLLRSGQVKLRKIDGWDEMERVKEAA